MLFLAILVHLAALRRVGEIFRSHTISLPSPLYWFLSIDPGGEMSLSCHIRHIILDWIGGEEPRDLFTRRSGVTDGVSRDSCGKTCRARR